MLVCLDLDNTLITSYMKNWDRDYHTWDVLPGRVEKLQRLFFDEGHQLVVVTNQGGVGMGHQTEQDFETKMTHVRNALNMNHLPVEVCFGHPDSLDPYYALRDAWWFRKPSGQMILNAVRRFSDQARQGVVMVGDSVEDEGAALVAGVPFQHSEEFFADTSGVLAIPPISLSMDVIQKAIDRTRWLKPNDRSARDRAYAVVLTELEKVFAYAAVYADERLPEE